MRGKIGNLTLLMAAELLAMSLWFSASAVVPELTREWDLSRAAQSWLTMSVQAGFVTGALLSAWINLADRLPAHRLVAWSALLGASFNAAIVQAGDPAPVLVLRFLTGVCLAGVYPPGMKLVASWTTRGRGLGIGLLVGALTVGSASPHLINGLPIWRTSGGPPPWRAVVLAASISAVLAAGIARRFVVPGPHLPAAAAFDWRYALAALRDRPARLANLGYLGHMWELYAMWTWVPLVLLHAYTAAGLGTVAGRVAGFSAIAVGAAGSALAGLLADRYGRTLVASASLVASGACCLVAGRLTSSPGLLTVVCLLWGFAVVADSAQFSAAVSELSDPAHVGTALTVQTCLGFLLTLVTIRLLPAIADRAGWAWAFAFLAPGPVAGLVAMLRLRGLPEAAKMASGKR